MFISVFKFVFVLTVSHQVMCYLSDLHQDSKTEEIKNRLQSKAIDAANALDVESLKNELNEKTIEEKVVTYDDTSYFWLLGRVRANADCSGKGLFFQFSDTFIQKFNRYKCSVFPLCIKNSNLCESWWIWH
jgi:hypothetical protein